MSFSKNIIFLNAYQTEKKKKKLSLLTYNSHKPKRFSPISRPLNVK